VTTETVEPTTEMIEALQAGIVEAQGKVTSLQAAMANDAATIMEEAQKSGDFSTLTARGKEIEDAKAAVVKATAKLDDASRASRWENLKTAREPIENVLHELLVDGKPMVAVTAVKGVAKIDDAGVVTVSLKPTLASLEMTELEAAVAATFDGPAFKLTNVTSIEINVIGLDTASPVVALKPTANVNIQFRNKAEGGTGAATGGLQYAYNGAMLGSRDFLVAVNASGSGEGFDYLTQKRAKTYETAINGTGFGLSELAKQTAKKMGITPEVIAASA